MIFKVKNIFEPNVLKWVMKTIFINSNPFAFLIINVKILSNFQKEWCSFGRKKKMFEKKKNYPHLKFKCFEHAKKKLICVKLWARKLYNYWKLFTKNLWKSKLLCFPMIFQTYKNAI